MYCALIACASAFGHQLTPTYPKLEPSYVPGIYRARMELFNSRQEIEYYEFEVFDENWNSVPFATAERIVHLPYLQRKTVDVFIRKKEIGIATYLCTKSKIIAGVHQSTVVSSKICSKLK